MADTLLAEYGRPLTIDFELWETDGTDFQVAAVHVAGDTVLLRDEAAQVNTTNGFIDEGTGYSIALTAVEMEAARIKLYVVDQGAKQWLDKAIRILTHSHPLAHDPRGVIAAGTAQAGTGTTITLAASESVTTDLFVGGVIELIDGTGAGQTPRVITDYDGTTKIATVSPNWVLTPDATSVYRVFSVPPSAGLQPDILAALTTYDAATITAVSAVTTDVSALLPTALSTGGRIVADIQSIKDTELTATPPFDTV